MLKVHNVVSDIQMQMTRAYNTEQIISEEYLVFKNSGSDLSSKRLSTKRTNV